MARRITRNLIQAAALAVLLLLFIFVADWRYKVLPPAIHHHFSAAHHAGTVITDIQVAFCSSVNPFSVCRLDPSRWHRIEKNLYLDSAWVKSAWLHVQRKKEADLTADDRVVMKVKVGPREPTDDGPWERRAAGIWLLRSGKRHNSDSDRVVTAVEILFGTDAVDPRPKWELDATPLGVDAIPIPRLSIQHGQPAETKATTPRIRKDGKFKILQISDAHLATGTGNCRDALEADGAFSNVCAADPRTLAFVERILDDEKPDLVVLSGDQVEGPAAPDTQTAIFKYAAPLISRRIPWAMIFGNHDDEGRQSLSREDQMAIIEGLPFGLSRTGPSNVDGVGNYYVEVQASQHSALTLYFLDTHGLTPDERRYRGYAWVKPSQIEWFKNTASSLIKEHKKYSHMHMDMAFIHIPLPEQASKTNIIKGGVWKEGVTAPAYNSHFYSALADAGIVTVGCGHDHVNDFCALPKDNLKGPWLCYAGGSGFGGYGGYGGYYRRMRVWEVDANAGRIHTWKRVECCGNEVEEKVDEVLLVDGGSVVH
ncbi:Metallo-dependent phosphatase [Piedraia hortae CBS 480.64]|uniref:Metallo-dependent phosphatase n=1 Tax=Piedraia hortae CBS 480.64 TaxID=1314780 RepID=A0A6A7BVN3_9PEZI|nr:Metallo-dependent phosphatase [Piedraia hortae CBS 480.64]